MIEIAALLIGTISTSLIALTVFIKNSRSLTNKLFVGLAIGLVGWSITTYFSLRTNSEEDTLLWIRLIMFFVIIQNTSFFLLVRVFPDLQSNLFSKLRYKLLIVYSVLTAGVAVSPFLFVDFKDGAPVPGPGMALFMPHAVVFAFGGFVALIFRYRRAQGVKKVQLQYFLAGTLLMFTLVPISNFIVPLALKSNRLVQFSPLYPLVFSLLIAYAIVRHRLFDIRSAAARTLAYVLSIGTIIAIYGFITFVILERFFLNSADVAAQRTVYVGLAVITGLLFQSVKRFFDKITNQVFYQDAYDTQQFLDQLNKALVLNVELEPLLTKVSDVVVANLKAEFSTFSLRETGYSKSRNIGVPRASLVELKHEILQEVMPEIKRRVIITEELGDRDETKDLHKLLQDNNISVLVRLVSTLKYNLGGLGYLALGPKKSGASYTPQDIRVIRIIANELVIAIENALRFEEIEKFNATLQEKVDDATKQLRRTNDKLKQLDETKDEFISMASHQLRTPLTSVKGYLSMVLEGDAGEISEMQRKLLDQAFVSSQRMVYLIADLLNVSRLRTGKFVIEPIASNLADVVEGEIGQLKDTAAGRGLELTYEKPEEFPQLYLDETKIRQVIMNFTDNAIYYTPSGGHIQVKLEDKGEAVEFTVSDDGMGVPKSEQPHLFTKFYRAGNARKARPDGTGLGLFMAKKVIVAQGGSLVFSSQEGKGSTFGFSFPKAKLQLPPEVQSGDLKAYN